MAVDQKPGASSTSPDGSKPASKVTKKKDEKKEEDLVTPHLIFPICALSFRRFLTVPTAWSRVPLPVGRGFGTKAAARTLCGASSGCRPGSPKARLGEHEVLCLLRLGLPFSVHEYLLRIRVSSGSLHVREVDLHDNSILGVYSYFAFYIGRRFERQQAPWHLFLSL